MIKRDMLFWMLTVSFFILAWPLIGLSGVSSRDHIFRWRTVFR